MGTYTPNLNLYKPDASDPFGEFREKFNDNMDILDNGGGGGGGGHTIVDENGSDMPAESKLQFTGSVSVTDDSINGKTIVDVAGGGEYFYPVIYSDVERKIGVWRDNKPLYKKTYHFNSTVWINANGWTNGINVDTTDVETLVDAEVLRTIGAYSFYGYLQVVPYNNLLNIFNCRNTNMEIDTITLFYTKISDVAGSGDYNTLGVPTVHYSTSEQVIGTWIDGKPLYQKTINITTPSVANAIVSVSDVTSLNIDTVVSLDGNYNDTNINWSLNIYFNTGRSANCFVNGGKTAIMMLVNDNVAMNKNAYVTIKYTKSTD